MEKAIHGKNVKLMFRLLKERGQKKAGLLALEMSHIYNRETNVETQATKDGSVATGGSIEANVEMEFLKTNTDVFNMLEYAYENGEEIEIWRIFFDNPVAGEKRKYKAQYGTGILSNFPDAAEAESNASVSTVMKLNGLLVNGEASVDAENDELAKAFFFDTVADAKPEEPKSIYTPQVKA
ncbi:phage major tail protein, TP901-1 family [Enterococcus rivorum]|uniref:Phage major tail protein, TP901-1 family n=1 Tax=Enterococcus rivorum TaxID=762845 RepID=A0A1E5KZG2_9ENTE|nr:phage major tail protein, TP901-1 family [Enterococcus rivorum]MBP2099348.1 TP901-1 family phage major tail protein [Enterococcus rivorum]OEH83213.1 phage major tail protein, TP901-1 family [Enterococcus rivorum]